VLLDVGSVSIDLFHRPRCASSYYHEPFAFDTQATESYAYLSFPSTITQNTNKTHVLDFTCDNDDSSGLTVLINDVRFHITVNPADLQISPEKPLYYKHLDKISALREAEEREKDRAEEEEAGEDADQDSASASLELQNWILAAFTDIRHIYAPLNREPLKSTLYERYHGPTYFHTLYVANGVLTPELMEPTADLEKSIEDLVPQMKLPKYVQAYNLPWISSADLTVQNEISTP
jgi:hypothetical protein